MTATAQGVGLAIQGGKKAVTEDVGDLFTWPIVTQEDEEAVLEVLRRGAMSATDVTHKFEADLSSYFDVRHALCHSTGTAAIYTDHVQQAHVIRKVLLRQSAILNYVNPF